MARPPVFSLFHSHLDLAHAYWSQLIRVGDHVVDATCGNGHDTAVLCQLALSAHSGRVYAFDIQLAAILTTQTRLTALLPATTLPRLSLHHTCHSHLAEIIPAGHIKAFVYNLGYLPGSNKEITTHRDTTLKSLQAAQTLLQPGGIISIMCYEGHAEGAQEQETLLRYAAQLPSDEWNCCHHTWKNRQKGPSLLLLQKSATAQYPDVPATKRG